MTFDTAGVAGAGELALDTGVRTIGLVVAVNMSV
jgi:hypothetical protein